jgi:hypothetical protein
MPSLRGISISSADVSNSIARNRRIQPVNDHRVNGEKLPLKVPFKKRPGPVKNGRERVAATRNGPNRSKGISGG